jgi:hypothetical protein
MLTAALWLMVVATPRESTSPSTDAPQVVELSPYRYWSVAQLRREYVKVEDLRPGYVAPMVSLMVGLTGMAVSLFAYAIALGTFRGPSETANIAFGFGGTISVVLAALGVVQLARTSFDRRYYGSQLDNLQRLADGQERDERLLDLWEQRHGPGALPPPIIGPPPKGPVPLPSAPPIVPGPALFPGQVSVMVPLLYSKF